jgi:hypothetical protein
MKASLKTTIMALMVICSHQAKAGNDGGGGYIYCAQYMDTAGRVAEVLMKIGQTKVNQESGVVKVDELWNIRIQMSCLPAQNLDRQARSNPETKHTELLVENSNGIIPWQYISKAEQLRLVVHELSVLARYENDGEYFVSDTILIILSKYSTKFKYVNVMADLVLENQDGSITMLGPYINYKGERYLLGYAEGTTPMLDANGTCTYFNLRNNNVSPFFAKEYMGLGLIKGIAVIDRQGHLVNVLDRQQYHNVILKSITCG